MSGEFTVEFGVAGDAGRGIVRIDARKMRDLRLNDEDVVKIYSKTHNTACKIKSESNIGKKVLMDTFIRDNLGVCVLDPVSIKKISSPLDAKKITMIPLEIDQHVKQNYVKKKLSGVILTVGDKVIGNKEKGHFKISNITPKNTAIVVKSTEFLENTRKSKTEKKPLSRHSTRRKNKVFLVHGHKKDILDSVKTFLQKYDLKPIVLEEKPGMGNTIIENFEKHASDVICAIVLAIGEDKCYRNEKRPRQNVILELGYFYGKLGRGKTMVMRNKNVTMPSNFNGITHIEYNQKDPMDWQQKLAQEIEANTKFKIDFNPEFKN